MKALTLLRHAKSSWADNDLSDHDRPLNARGLRDAPVMAARLVQRACIPTEIFCSSALRTRETADAMLSAFELDPDRLLVTEELYLASAGKLLDIIGQANPDIEHLMIIAHNPGLEDLARALNQQNALPMPTAAVCHFVVEQLELESLEEAIIQLDFHDSPKSGH